MIKKLFFSTVLACTLIGCQFTETLVLNEDGSGSMSVEVNMNEMMAFGGAAMMDSLPTKIDTIISMKQFLIEKKDSIAQLPAVEQQQLMRMENYKVHINMNTATSEMVYDISTNFKSISEANNLLNGLDQASNFMPGMGASSDNEEKNEDPTDIIGVKYSFEKGIFKRDAYIIDKKMHSQQLDSLKNSEAFMSGMEYTLNYTFPKPIKKSSNPDATYSLNKKTLTLKKSFVEYFKNPDILDLEVELEK